MDRAALRWCSLLALLAASVAGEMLSWPECPCQNIPYYGTCTRIKARQTPDNTDHLNINLQNCNIREISSLDFNYPNARWVDLRNNYIQQIDADIFKHLTKVNYLSLEDNKFSGKEINHEAFQKCSQLFGIGLNGNDMREAPDDLVEGIRDLQEMHLKDTSLSEVPLFVKRASNLTHLYLSKNEIMLPDPDTFSTLLKLKILHLDHNRIQFIPENIFQSLSDIKTIYLDYNRLTFIPDNLFANLTKLKHLRLQNNAIQYISQYVFRHIGNLEELDISKNRITQLSENFISRVSQPKQFFFSGNPWDCYYLNQLLNQVIERQIEHYNKDDGNQGQYVCYKCLDFAFTDNILKARTPELTYGAIGQWNITNLDYCP